MARPTLLTVCRGGLLCRAVRRAREGEGRHCIPLQAGSRWYLWAASGPGHRAKHGPHPLFSDPETIPFELPYTLLPDGTAAGEAVISCTAGGDIRIGLTAETYVDAVVTVLGGPYDISDWQGRTVELSEEPVTITLRNPTPGDASSCSPGGYTVDVESA